MHDKQHIHFKLSPDVDNLNQINSPEVSESIIFLSQLFVSIRSMTGRKADVHNMHIKQNEEIHPLHIVSGQPLDDIIAPSSVVFDLKHISFLSTVYWTDNNRIFPLSCYAMFYTEYDKTMF